MNIIFGKSAISGIPVFVLNMNKENGVVGGSTSAVKVLNSLDLVFADSAEYTKCVLAAIEKHSTIGDNKSSLIGNNEVYLKHLIFSNKLSFNGNVFAGKNLDSFPIDKSLNAV